MQFTEQQLQAISVKNMSVAVSAAAGSGKTAVLTQRIIERVCATDGSGDISRILAVTFTKAAAAEMASRISRALSDKLANDPSNRHIARQSLLVSSAKISTIHHFCLDIIRENFERLSLPSDFKAADTARVRIMAKKTMEELIDDYFDENVSENEKIGDFSSFANVFGNLENTDTLSHTLINIYDSLSSKLKFIDALDDNIQMYTNVSASNFSESIWGKELSSHTAEVMSHYRRIFEDALELSRVNDIYRAAEKAFLSDLEFIDDVLGELRRGATYFDVKKALDAFSPPNLYFGKKENASELTEFYASERKKFRADVKNLAETYYRFSEEEISRFCAETARYLEQLKIVLEAFDARFRAEKTRRHIISFSDMEHYALSILWDRETDAPSAAALRLRDSFDEIYVDEYQDTNEVQDKIFSLISRKDNKFCVGDVKQSIYGFRGAEPKIFTKMLDTATKYYSGYSGDKTKIFLSQNFRSSNEIVDFCNAIFETLMNVGEERYGEDERLCAGLDKSCGEAELAYVQNEDGEDNSEAEFVAAKICELASAGRKFSEMAILLRYGTHADAFKAALEKRNIPCKNTMEKHFFESPDVLLILSVLNVIDNPARDVHLAAALKSPIFGVSLEELIYIRRYGSDSLYDALCAFTKDVGFRRGERFLSFLSHFRTVAQSATCDELIWQIYIETDIFSVAGKAEEFEISSSEQAKSNLIQLYNYARTFGGSAYRNLYDFITFINDIIDGDAKVDLAPFETSGDAVEIMTMHNSKGLEYPVCFVSGLGGEFSNIGLGNDVITTPMGIVPKLVHPSGFAKIQTPQYVISLIPERRARAEEELRVLYVALTRAREKLILTAKADRRSKEPRSIDISADGINALSARYISKYSLTRTKRFIDLIAIALAGKGKCRVIDERPKPTFAFAAPEKIAEDVSLAKARSLVRERLSYVYPYAELSSVPSKMAVSQLYPDLLDEGETEAREASFDYVPRFLSGEDTTMGAAERGTATHTFMQFFDFDRVDATGVENEIKYLAERGFIFEEDIKKIDVRAVEKFLSSTLAKKMRAAKKIWREKRFIISFDADGFTENDELKQKLKGEKMLVQGVIDCAYVDEDGRITIVDYKTDHFRRGTKRDEIIKTMRERHTRQLSYYKAACERLFGEVGRVCLYSFAIGDTIDILTEEKQ